jgi:hypothetical protein
MFLSNKSEADRGGRKRKPDGSYRCGDFVRVRSPGRVKGRGGEVLGRLARDVPWGRSPGVVYAHPVLLRTRSSCVNGPPKTQSSAVCAGQASPSNHGSLDSGTQPAEAVTSPALGRGWEYAK